MQYEIILCTGCEGKGIHEWDECTNYHKREYDTHSSVCQKCGGSGRMQKITTVEYEPFVTPKPTE